MEEVVVECERDILYGTVEDSGWQPSVATVLKRVRPIYTQVTITAVFIRSEEPAVAGGGAELAMGRKRVGKNEFIFKTPPL